MTPAQYNEYQRQADVIEEAKKWKEEQDKNKTMTAVEWLQDKLNNLRPTQICSIETIKEWVEKAKEMEKQQIIDAYYQCGRDNFEHIKVINRSATDYYNETYGSKGSDDTPKCTCNVDPFLCQIHKKDMFEKPFMDFAKQYVEQLKPKKDY